MKRRFQPKLYSLLLLLLLVSATTMAQQTVVTGSVKSSKDGLPVIGATVTLQDSKVATITDKDGAFRLPVPSLNGVINFTYAGMVPVSEKINGRNIINLTMNMDEKQLTEVVVTAIGIERDK